MNTHPASAVVKEKLYASGGTAVIPLLNGDACRINACPDGHSFTSNKLTNDKIPFNYCVFDTIVELLRRSPAHQAKKGTAHGKKDKVGFGKCTEDTVMGYLAIHYMHKPLGASAYDPVFVLAAVLNWADIAENCRGYLKLNPEFF